MKNKPPQHFIGIDSGGTKCELLITGENKQVVYNKKFKGYHYSVYGAAPVAENVSGYIKTSLKSSGLNLQDIKGICIGLAGAREGKDRKDLKKAFIKHLKYNNISIQSDALAGIYGAFEGKDGIIIISGTGSVLYGIYRGELTRIGGWGRILGDYGAGYTIGKMGLQELVKEYDELPVTGEHSMLGKTLEKKLGLNRKNIMEKIFHKNFPIQTAAPVVLECAERKDKKSAAIINEALEGLLYHIDTFLKVVKPKNELGLAFIGSIVETDNVLSRKLKKEIRKKFRKINVMEKKNSPAYGAVLLAEKEFNR